MGKGWGSQPVKLQDNEKVRTHNHTAEATSGIKFGYLVFMRNTVMRSEISTVVARLRE